MICFPSGEEHGQHRHESGESANLGRAIAYCCGFEQTGKRAVQGVNAMAARRQFLPYRRIGHTETYSNSSPSGLEVPVLRACLPSTLSMVEYIHMPNAKL